jgi:hypothetical protein
MKPNEVAITWITGPLRHITGSISSAPLISHIKADAIQRQFKKIAKVYCGIYHYRVYTTAPDGTILYDTDRGDWIPYEVRRVKNSKDPILLVGRLKTEAGRKALEERLRK